MEDVKEKEENNKTTTTVNKNLGRRNGSVMKRLNKCEELK